MMRAADTPREGRPSLDPANLRVLALAALGILAVIAPFWLAVVPPLTDVSQHVLVARILDKFADGAYRFPEYFEIAWTGSPAEVPYMLLRRLQHLVGPYTDARLYLTAFVVALSASAWALARAVRVETPLLAAVLVLPLGSCYYVYAGLLPFLATFPLFALALAVWLIRLHWGIKVPLLWATLLVLYSFHVVGAAAAVLVIAVSAGIAALRRPRSPAELLQAAVAVAPVVVVAARYVLGADGPQVTIDWGGLSNVVYSVLYTSFTLSGFGLFPMALWMLLIAAAALWQWRCGLLPGWLMASAAALGALSVVLPISLGSLWPAGPRLLPFAMILLASGLSIRRRHATLVGAAVLALVLAVNVPNAWKARDLDREFRQFLSGVRMVDAGSTLLPVLVEPYAGARAIWPFWSLASAYTVYRGGATPYVFATPYIKTSASPLRYRRWDDFRYAFLYEPERKAGDYRGVGRDYDYVLVWGVDAALAAVLSEELRLVHQDGKLSLYASTRRARTGQ